MEVKKKSDYSEEGEEIEYDNLYVDNNYHMQKMEKIQQLEEKSLNFLRDDEEITRFDDKIIRARPFI